MNFPAFAEGSQGSDIQDEIGDFEYVFAAELPAPRQCADAREQFQEGKWLGEVIVGACIQATDNVGHGVARGEHQHGGFLLAVAKPAGHFQAVHLREHDVQQDDVKGGFCRLFQCRAPIACQADFKLLLAKPLARS